MATAQESLARSEGSMYLILAITNFGNFGNGSGDPGRIRTSDLRFRKPSLYPSELQGQHSLFNHLHPVYHLLNLLLW